VVAEPLKKQEALIPWRPSLTRGATASGEFRHPSRKPLDFEPCVLALTVHKAPHDSGAPRVIRREELMT